MAGTGTDLEGARGKLREHAWRDAFELLTRCDEIEPLGPADLEGMAEAAWWNARLDDCLAARERAFALYQEAGNTCRAAYVAILLAKDNFATGRGSVGMAWIGRAERLLEGVPECIETGHLERTRSVMAYEGRGDYEAALAHAERAIEIGTKLKDKDLIALAVFDKGRSLAAVSRVEEGMALMDEATVAAVSGELTPLTTGFIYCNMISTCEELSDFRRAADWTEASRRWCERQAIAGFPGLCRVHRAGVIRLRGELIEAAAEAERACEEVAPFNRSYAAEGFYELGRIRLEMGALDDAEAAFRHAHELGRDPQPGMALLQLRRGRAGTAVAGLTRAAEEEKRELFLARLLPALVEVQIAAGELDGADRTAQRLQEIAETFGSPALVAEATGARARIALARGAAAEAAQAGRAALAIWSELEIPYEVGRCRVVLARAYEVLEDHDTSGLEMDAARSIFRSIGAVVEIESHDHEPRASSSRCTLRREGEYWTLDVGSRAIRLRDSKGLHHVARLIQTPETQVHVLDLVTAEEGVQPSSRPPTRADDLTTSLGTGDAGELLDPQAKLAYRRRLEELREELEESEDWGDTERAAKARYEMQVLTEELSKAVGLGGRDRRAASASERARVNVTRAIRSTLDRIAEHDGHIARSLGRAISTGTFCAYHPEPDLEIVLDL